MLRAFFIDKEESILKTIVSGIQPTGSINVGTYLGSIRNFVALQEAMPEHHFYIFIADMHAITVQRDRLELRKTIKELAAIYLACGLNPERVSLFIQSEVIAHAQMAHLLECHAYIGELERMTQFKEKARAQESGVSVGLFTYPVLMAGDILLYDAEYVPVGDDQKQHLELTRDIAIRMNNRYGECLRVPKPLFPKIGARIMSLTEPTKKMSKSDTNVKSKIHLLDDDAIIRKRIMSAVTDSEGVVRFDKDNKPGISNLMAIYGAVTNLEYEAIENAFKDADYQTFKKAVADALVGEIAPIKARYKTIVESGRVDEILDEGAEQARRLAQKKIAKLYHKVGLGRKRK